MKTPWDTVNERELERLGKNYKKAHGFAPDRVRHSGRKQRRKARKALGDGAGWLSRLAMLGDGLQHITLNLSSLGLEHLETEFSLYDHSAVSSIKAGVLNEFTGPVWTRLEVGKARKLHVHALAFEAPKSQHSTKQVHDLKGIALYLSKLQVPGDDLSIGIFLEAQKQARAAGHKRLPKTSFQRGIPTS